ncbi:hypothetical protein T492DRAFT_849204 [Pavlovales sp. CCMP2436]|nr:hypothetical protein T492DRAFT_849204 [Pavlovales sp. CCMP2436]
MKCVCGWVCGGGVAGWVWAGFEVERYEWEDEGGRKHSVSVPMCAGFEAERYEREGRREGGGDGGRVRGWALREGGGGVGVNHSVSVPMCAGFEAERYEREEEAEALARQWLVEKAAQEEVEAERRRRQLSSKLELDSFNVAKRSERSRAYAVELEGDRGGQ